MLVYGKYERFVLQMFVACVHPVTLLNVVEVANYNMRHVSASKWREQELFSWWFVHGMYHYTG